MPRAGPLTAGSGWTTAKQDWSLRTDRHGASGRQTALSVSLMHSHSYTQAHTHTNTHRRVAVWMCYNEFHWGHTMHSTQRAVFDWHAAHARKISSHLARNGVIVTVHCNVNYSLLLRRWLTGDCHYVCLSLQFTTWLLNEMFTVHRETCLCSLQLFTSQLTVYYCKRHAP